MPRIANFAALMVLGLIAVPLGFADEPVGPDTKAQAPADAKPAAEAPALPERVRVPPPPITWTDPEIEKVSKMLIGNWKSAAPVPEAGKPTEMVDVGMFIARVRSDDVPDLLYVEAARLDAVQSPFRQAFFQVYHFKDGLRLRTFELVHPIGGAMVGMWTNPDLFPPVARRDLVATIDIDLKPDGDGYSGKTPYPFPTGVRNAVEMTSEVSFGPQKFQTADRGYDSAGKLVWGAKEGEFVAYTRFESPVKTFTSEKGVYVIEYKRGTDAKVCKLDDQISIHYLGFLKDGLRFDSSLDREPPNPMTFRVTTKQVIPGFVESLLGSNVGTFRRVVIPYELAYGKYGNGRARIPPYADLYFDFEIMKLSTPAVEAPSAPYDPETDPNIKDKLRQLGPDGKLLPKDSKVPSTTETPKPTAPPSAPQPK